MTLAPCASISHSANETVGIRIIARETAIFINCICASPSRLDCLAGMGIEILRGEHRWNGSRALFQPLVISRTQRPSHNARRILQGLKPELSGSCLVEKQASWFVL